MDVDLSNLLHLLQHLTRNPRYDCFRMTIFCFVNSNLPTTMNVISISRDEKFVCYLRTLPFLSERMDTGFTDCGVVYTFVGDSQRNATASWRTAYKSNLTYPRRKDS